MIHEMIDMDDFETPDDTPCLDTTFHDIERTGASEDARWSAWLQRGEKLAGLTSLDGDEYDGADGYSLDSAYASFEAGVTPAQYIAGIPARLAARVTLGYEAYVKTSLFNPKLA
jgi:hypothetical protein